MSQTVTPSARGHRAFSREMPYHYFRDPNEILNVSTQGNLRLTLSELPFDHPMFNRTQL